MQDVDKKLQYVEALKKEFQKVGILYSKHVISKDKNVSRRINSIMVVMHIRKWTS